MSRKRTSPVAHIVFSPSGGGVRMVAEALPDTTEGIECTIVNKFLGAVGREQDCVFEAPTREHNGWPDAETRVGSRQIGIELVEVVSADHARRRGRQREYSEALAPRLTSLAMALAGISITVDDGAQEPLWPRVTSPEGQEHLDRLVEGLRGAVEDLQRLKPGHTLHRRWEREGSPSRLGIIAMRARPIHGSLPAGDPDVRFSESFSIGVAELHLLLAGAIREKVEKHYAAYAPGDLWLLAHTHSFPVLDEPSLTLARAFLRRVAHPFSQVWAFVPFPGEADGHAVRVWPEVVA